ncbi:MAG: FAD-binding oxidoreductase [Hydrogenibacillus schlegelii]|nr:FAD-binding oxidoreductase [Hydrogenibacillus schlegelii]
MPQKAAQPSRVVVIGAGMVGLSTAWFLLDRGVDVTVLESRHVAAGASWGNAGWLTPGLTAPLPHPSVLRFGLRALFRPDSPLYVPIRPSLSLLRFLLGFARHSTHARWTAGVRAYAPMIRRAYAAYGALAESIGEPVYDAEPFLAGFRTPEEAQELIDELESLRKEGIEVEYERLTGEDARRLEPALSSRVRAAVRLDGQRFIHPGRYIDALARSVRDRGGDIREGTAAREVVDENAQATVVLENGERLTADAVVIATGADLSRLAKRFGVRTFVQAGRGYSFSIPMKRLPAGPVYFPVQRVACTPLGDRLRVAGMMEFRRPEEPLDPRRIDAIIKAVEPLLEGADFADRRDEWVGSRPCTADGLPLIGRTASPRVFVAGGHCMWGIFLGPVTGKLVAEAVATGNIPAELRPFDPLR